MSHFAPAHPLKVLRKVLDLTQESFAGELGWSSRTIKRIEKGEATLSEADAEFISLKYAVPKGWLLEKEVSSPPPSLTGGIVPRWPRWDRLGTFANQERERWLEDQSLRAEMDRAIADLEPIGLIALRQLLAEKGPHAFHEIRVSFLATTPEHHDLPWPSPLPRKWTIQEVSLPLWEFARSPELWKDPKTLSYDLAASGSSQVKLLPADEASSLVLQVARWDEKQIHCRSGRYHNHPELAFPRSRHARVWALVNRIAASRIRNRKA